MIIAWTNAMYEPASSAQVADVNGHRLYVRRTEPGARRFIGSIDGVAVKGGWDTIVAAQAAVAVEFRSRFPEASQPVDPPPVRLSDGDGSELTLSGGECPGCGRMMSVRERVDQGVCNDCAAGEGHIRHA